MTIADKLTLLASSKEALRVKLGLSKSLPFGEYVNYLPEWSPKYLFRGGKQGVWYDPSDITTLFQDVAGTVPVTKDGDPVALMKDKSGNGNHATQSVSTSRPVYKTDGVLHWLRFDGVDDYLHLRTPAQNSAPYLFSIAYKTILATVTSYVFDTFINSNRFYIVSTSSDVAISAGARAVFKTPDTEPVALAALIQGANSDLYLNKAKSVLNTGANVVQGNMFIGCRPTLNSHHAMEMYSFMTVYNTSSVEVTALDYLNTKAGVTL